jgi:hypothetical protein
MWKIISIELGSSTTDERVIDGWMLVKHVPDQGSLMGPRFPAHQRAEAEATCAALNAPPVRRPWWRIW